MSQSLAGRSDSDHLLEECLLEMNSMLHELRSIIGFPDTAGRQRVLLDAISASLTLATITTVGTVTTVTTVTTVGSVTNQAQMGSFLTNMDQMSAINAVPVAQRGAIVVS